MKISRIKISNHSRVADIDLEVREHAVMVGPNAVGKSTILRLMDALLGATWNQLVASMDPSHIREGSLPMAVEVKLDDLTDEDVAHFADKIEVGVGDASGQRWLTARLVASVSSDDPERLEFSRSFIKPQVQDAAIARADLQQIGWVFLPANRSPERELGSGRTSAVRSLLRSTELNAAESKVIEDAFASLSAALEASSSLETLRSDLATELSALLPAPVDKSEIAVDLPSTLSGEPFADLDVHLERGGVKSPLGAQSDGLRSLAVIAVQLLAKRSARILAIDEPEIHLHPRGQANLASLLVASPGQRLVATHAPAVLSRFAPSDAIAITSSGARQLPPTPFQGRPKHFQQWWVETALEPLTAERVILVEGVSDRIIVQAVSRLLGHDLDRSGVTVVSLNGAQNFGAAIRLFGPEGFRLRLLGLVDEKEAILPAKWLGVSVDELHSLDFLVCDVDLEEEYVSNLGVPDTVSLLVSSGLFTEAQILSTVNVPRLEGMTTTDLAGFIRKDNKVESATALSLGMTAAQAAKLSTLKKLVERAFAP